MKRRFMFAIIGWMGGTLMGWYIQRLSGWYFPVYLGFVTGVLAVVGGEHAGKIPQAEEPSNPHSLFSQERRQSQ